MPLLVKCHCGQPLQVRDEDAGKRVRCPRCGSALAVPRPATPPQAIPVAPIPAAQPAPVVPAPVAEPSFFVLLRAERRGPFQLSRLAAEGVTADSLVWRQGMTEWARAADVPELAGTLRA